MATPPTPKAKSTPTVPVSPLRREDRPGHLDPKHAASLREQSGKSHDDDRAFVGGKHAKDALAEELGEGAVSAMTSGEDGYTEDLQGEVDEDTGGPFVETSGDKEYADGTDGSNPDDAAREPFPKT